MNKKIIQTFCLTLGFVSCMEMSTDAEALPPSCCCETVTYNAPSYFSVFNMHSQTCAQVCTIADAASRPVAPSMCTH